MAKVHLKEKLCLQKYAPNSTKKKKKKVEDKTNAHTRKKVCLDSKVKMYTRSQSKLHRNEKEQRIEMVNGLKLQ